MNILLLGPSSQAVPDIACIGLFPYYINKLKVRSRYQKTDWEIRIFKLTFSSQSFIGSFKGSTSYSLVQAHFAAGYRLSSYSYGINMMVHKQYDCQHIAFFKTQRIFLILHLSSPKLHVQLIQIFHPPIGNFVAAMNQIHQMSIDSIQYQSTLITKLRFCAHLLLAMDLRKVDIVLLFFF